MGVTTEMIVALPPDKTASIFKPILIVIDISSMMNCKTCIAVS